MQILSPVQLSPQEIQRLKSWLQSSDAQLFTDTLRARAYLADLKSAALLKAAFLRRDMQGERAEVYAGESALLENVVEELEHVANDESLMVRLIPAYPGKPEPEAPEE